MRVKKEKMTMLEVSPWFPYVPFLFASNVFLCILLEKEQVILILFIEFIKYYCTTSCSSVS
jgi:hypothetical protein